MGYYAQQSIGCVGIIGDSEEYERVNYPERWARSHPEEGGAAGVECEDDYVTFHLDAMVDDITESIGSAIHEIRDWLDDE